MGQATRNIANSFSTSGVISSSAINNSTLGNITDLSVGGSLILISEQTASGDANLSFTSGIDSTYDEYLFIWHTIHPSLDGTGKWSVNFSTDGGSNYNVTKTSTMYYSRTNEGPSETGLTYYNGGSLAQGTGFQTLAAGGVGGQTDECCQGWMRLFNPSSTTYVKHYITRDANYQDSNYINDSFVGGYCNTTSAVNAVRFQLTSGNIDAGTIQMFGVK